MKKLIMRNKKSTNNLIRFSLLGGVLFLLLPCIAQADPPSNANLVQRVEQLEAQVKDLQEKLASVSVLTVNGQPTVRFTGVNVQVINGEGSTATANGTGNLIVGYDESNPFVENSRCTLGTNSSIGTPVVSEADCASAGGDWLQSFKTGSHYLVVGTNNNYSRWGGIVAGFGNTSNYDYASVSGGINNIASGAISSLIGGHHNVASGPISTVSGGLNNIASGYASNVSGGNSNTASGSNSTVSGGVSNKASGAFSSVSGGGHNKASGDFSSVSGGGGIYPVNGNTASGNFSSILGGASQNATGVGQTIPALP